MKELKAMQTEMSAISRALTRASSKLGKTSKLAEAVRYAFNQRAYVERCFTDGGSS